MIKKYLSKSNEKYHKMKPTFLYIQKSTVKLIFWSINSNLLNYGFAHYWNQLSNKRAFVYILTGMILTIYTFLKEAAARLCFLNTNYQAYISKKMLLL